MMNLFDQLDKAFEKEFKQVSKKTPSKPVDCKRKDNGNKKQQQKLQ